MLLFVTMISFSQEKESALDKISKLTCDYINSDKFKKLNTSDKTANLGVFIISNYSKFKKELAAEGLEFDFTSDKDGGRKFGEKVGVNMVRFCPEALIALSKLADEDDDEVEEEEVEPTYFVTGELVKITGKDYSVVYLRNKNDETLKFVWLGNFTGSNKLIYTKKVKGLKVKLQYRNLEWYAPKLKEYITKKEIIGIEYLDE